MRYDFLLFNPTCNFTAYHMYYFNQFMINRKLFLTVMFPLLAVYSFSQDTVWLSKTGIVTPKDAAARFQVVYKNKTDTQRVQLLRYLRDGSLQEELNFFPFTPTRVLEGIYKRYNNGQLVDERNYSNNKLNGAHKTYWSNGQLRRIDNYNDGIFTDGSCYKQDGTDTAWFVHHIPASFPGGNDSLRLFMARNFRYPAQASRDGIQGTVRVQFTITKEGNLEDIEVVNKVNPLLDGEALRIVKRMPTWIPAVQDGEYANMLFILPVVFRLSDD
jgi:TonB family protein